jgi:hypothetical protein
MPVFHATAKAPVDTTCPVKQVEQVLLKRVKQVCLCSMRLRRRLSTRLVRTLLLQAPQVCQCLYFCTSKASKLGEYLPESLIRRCVSVCTFVLVKQVS